MRTPTECTREFVGDGEDLGLLIGHHGQTIDAIQHLAYRIAVWRGRPQRVVLVDAAGYRERAPWRCGPTADQAAEAGDPATAARSRWRR